MKRLLVCLAVLALSVPAFAADVARHEDVYIEGIPGSFSDEYGRGPSLVVSYTLGTFTDTGPAFQAALDVAGMPADIMYDPYGVFPPLDDYCLICIVTNDMWWTYDYWAVEDPIFSAFMASGGTCMVDGQDYLWSRLMGTAGFPTDWLGVAGANQDMNWDAFWLDVNGTPGGPMDGIYAYLTPCFGANNFFTDEIIPAATGMAFWTSDQVGFPLEGGSSTPVSCFSTMAFGCAATDDLNNIICAWVRWLDFPTPTETTTWGAVKGMFR